MPKSDNELIAEFLTGDQVAAGNLVKRYQSPIRQFLRRLTAGDHALADDIGQETFIRMLTGLGSFRGDAARYFSCQLNAPEDPVASDAAADSLPVDVRSAARRVS